MKLILTFLCIWGAAGLLHAQITSPILKANFGIEGDLGSNYFNGAADTQGDDWFSNNYPGTGDYIIDTSGASAIVSRYTSNVSSRSWSFSRLMRQAPYTLLNNNLLLDAVFHRDFHGDDSTAFASGSNKNGMSPSLWNCPVSQGVPDKNDVLDAFTHVRRAGPNPTDSLWMFAGISIENTTGSRYFDFELYQTDIVYNRASRTFTGFGPDAGHTSWVFDGAGNILTRGDIIFTAEFSSASLTLVEARIWVSSASLALTPTDFSWGGDFDGDGAHAAFGYANILPKTAGAFYTGIQNTVSAWAGPFKLVRVDNSVVTDYLPRQFMEFSVNLTKLGLEFGSFSSNPCGTPFRRVLIKSRSSTSFTSELKDFIAPFSMFDYAKVDATTDLPYYCGTMPATTINVVNPLSTSIYTWTTTDGNITGSTTGTGITIDKGGTYYVKQRLHPLCPLSSIDSVTILFASSCTVLDVGFKSFLVSRSGSSARLHWQASHNEQASSFLVEYSNDQNTYTGVAVIPASPENGTVEYDFSCAITGSEPALYYRVSVTGKNLQKKYSRARLLRLAGFRSQPARIFPNPATSGTWLTIPSVSPGAVYIEIHDLVGRLLGKRKVQLNKGENLLKLGELTGQKGGMYLVRIKKDGDETTLPVMVSGK
jgi:hypothetical protein